MDISRRLPQTNSEIRQWAQDQFVERLRSQGRMVLVDRMNDTADVRGSGRGLSKARKGHLASQPGDFIVHPGNAPLYIAEVKGTMNKEGFAFTGAHLRPKQITWIRQIAEFGCSQSYYVIIRAFAIDRWYMLPATAVARRLGKTVKFSELEEFTWNIV